MLTPAQIADVCAYAQAQGVRRLLIDAPGLTLRLAFPAGSDAKPHAAMPAPPAVETAVPVLTPGFGVFLAAHPLAASSFVEPGDAVRRGDILGLLRSGLIYRPVRAPRAGTVEAVALEPGALVGYGQELLRLRHPEDADD